MAFGIPALILGLVAAGCWRLDKKIVATVFGLMALHPAYLFAMSVNQHQETEIRVNSEETPTTTTSTS